MGYILFAIALIVMIFIFVAFFSKVQVQGSDGGLDETTGPQNEQKPNEEFIEKDPTHRED